MKGKKHKILLISSSTGGHAIPVLELALGFSSKDNVEVAIIHSGSEVEKKLFVNFKTVKISSGKIIRKITILNFWQGIKLFLATLKSLYILMLLKPDVVFSKGGFNAVPTLFWSKVLKIPYFIHESDIVMGLSNKSFTKDSQKTYVSFPLENYPEHNQKFEYSGMIIRDIPIIQNKKVARKIIYITGGSQGASAINKVVWQMLKELLERYTVIHQIGANQQNELKTALTKIAPDLAEYYTHFEFSIDQSVNALSTCDLIISRAGSSIFEFAALSKASILIPYPHAAGDHQTKNAKYLERRGGALVIPQEKLNSKILFERIKFLLAKDENIATIGKNANHSLKTDGKDYIICDIMKFLGEE